MKGGKREGAGRKPKDAELKELELIDSAINQDDWARLYKVIFEKAMKGDMMASRLVLDRRWGKAKEHIEHSGAIDGFSIAPIEWVGEDS
jgi:hypothetical protein